MENLTKVLNIFIIILSYIRYSSSNTDESEKLTENRIFGGFTCSTEEFPFMTLIMLRAPHGWVRHCGGSLIDSSWVLTASHCITSKQPQSYYIIAGINSSNGKCKYLKLKEIFVHPNFDEGTLENDIALIRLYEPVARSEHINFIPLPLRSFNLSYIEKLCKFALVLGWGYISHNKDVFDISKLQCAFLPLLSTDSCAKLYHGFSVTNEMNICTLSKEGKDACQGDSGGPLVCSNIQVGIISWGVDCGLPDNPGIYTRVDKYINFIDEIKRRPRSYVENVTFSYYIFMLLLFIFNIN